MNYLLITVLTLSFITIQVLICHCLYILPFRSPRERRHYAFAVFPLLNAFWLLVALTNISRPLIFIFWIATLYGLHYWAKKKLIR